MIGQWLRAKWLAAGLLAFLVSGCGPGFQAISWDDHPEEIVSIINDQPATLGDPPNIIAIPKEMPALPPGSVPSMPFHEKSVPPTVAVPSFNMQGGMPQTKLVDVVNLADVNAPPYKAGGRLQAHFPKQDPLYDSFCTAQFVGNEGVVLTAAHCVYDAAMGGWPNRLKFKLRYDNGAVAQTYDWQCMAIVRGWLSGQYPYDYAFVKVRGAPESGMGLKLNMGAAQVDAIGYPQKYYATERMVHVLGNKNGTNPSQMNPNPMGKGSSGGAWIDSGSNAVSVNSFYYTNDPSKTYGPVFTASTLSVYEHVNRGCTDNIKPLGTDIAGNPFKSRSLARAGTVLSDVYEPLGSGSTISVVDDRSCGCTGKSVRLSNNLTEPRVVGFRTTSTGAGKTSENEIYRLLAPSSSVGLGCTIYRSTPRASCDAARSSRLIYDRRASVATPVSRPRGTAAALLALNQSRIQSDIQACVRVCTGSTTRQCLELGRTAVAALAPLSQFLDAASVPGSNGSVVRKADIISGFGGDPATAKDPCDRSDLDRESNTVVNRGRGCSLRTEKILPTSYTFLTNLMMRPTVRANTSPVGGKSVAYFNDLAVSPGLEFVGQNSATYNKRYGGDIYAVTQSGPDHLVLATANSCVRGVYRAH